MEVCATSGSAARAGSVAGVGTAGIIAIVFTSPPAVAHVSIAEGGGIADLFDTNRGGTPEVACAGTVAGTVEAT